MQYKLKNGIRNSVYQHRNNQMIRQIIKRLIDNVLSTVCILLFCPLMVVIAVYVKLQDKGPAFFIQERAGKNGAPFPLLKFRTMKVNTVPFGQSPSTSDDSRIIKGGHLLREYSLDELPQLFNVLIGHMSMIGPRPLYVSQIELLSEEHRTRLLVRPGITGLSQVYLRSELTSQKSLDMEVAYVQKQNLWSDIKIFFLTIYVVLTKKGVYEQNNNGARQ